MSTCSKTGPDHNTATAALHRWDYSGMPGILNKKKKVGFWTDLKQTADVPCVLHAHCSPDVGPMNINTCEGPLSLSLSKLFHFLDSEGSRLVSLWLLFPLFRSLVQTLHRRFRNISHSDEQQTHNQSLKDPFNTTEHPLESDYHPTDWKHLTLILPSKKMMNPKCFHTPVNSRVILLHKRSDFLRCYLKMLLVDLYFFALLRDETIPVFQRAFCEHRLKSS